MKELYWITRLDSVLNLAIGIKVCAWILLTLVLIALVIYYICIIADEISEEYITSNMGKRFKRTLCAFGIPSFIIVILTSLIIAFVPSTKEACMIYLGGSVVDYVQGSEKIQEMPDKVVNLASDYLDELISKNSKKNATKQESVTHH